MEKARTTNTKIRWFINIFLIIVMLLTTIFVSIFYLKPQLKTESSTRIQGTNTTLKVNETSNQNLANKNLPSKKEILEKVKRYLQNTNNSLSTYDISSNGKNLLSIKNYNAKTDEEKINFIKSLINKPYLTFTDSDGNPIFYRGKFQSKLDPNRKTLQDFLNGDPADFMPDLVQNPASATNNQGYTNRVSLKFTEDGWKEYIKYGTEAYYLYLYRGLAASNMYAWLNLKEFIEKHKNDEGWDGNPVKFAYADGRLAPEEKSDGKDKNKKNAPKYKINPYLKEIARNYLIASGHPLSFVPSNSSLSSHIFLPNENKNGYSDEQVASAINYAMSPFELTEEYTYYITTSFAATNKYLIVLGALYAMFAVFLLVRYRFFGLIAAISIAFFIVIVLTTFVALGILITPIIAITIIVALILAFDLIHNFLDNIKRDIQEGGNAIKAINKSTKTSLITSLDAIVSLIIMAIFATYISVSYSNAIGVSLFIVIFSCFFIASILNTLLLHSFAKIETFDKAAKYILWSNKYSQVAYTKVNLISKAKFFLIGFAIFLLIVIIVPTSIGLASSQMKNGINLSPELKGGFDYFLKPNLYWTESETQSIIDQINSTLSTSTKNFTISRVLFGTGIKQNYGILINSPVDIMDQLNNIKSSVNSTSPLYSLWQNSNIIKNEIIAGGLSADISFSALIILCSLLVVGIYQMIRYSWVTLVILFVKAISIIVLTLGFLLITYSQLNINVLDALILANVFVAYDTAINNSMLNFELKKDLNTKNFVYTDSKLEEIFKKHTIDMFSRQIALLAIGIVLIPLILTLMTTTNKTLVLTLSYSIISLFFVNMFLIPMIKLSIFKAKYRLKAKRIENKYWQSKSVEEQMFIGINDYAM